MPARRRLKRPYGVASRGEARLPKAPLISIVEDDEFFRDSMRSLMRSLGYAVETFPRQRIFSYLAVSSRPPT